MKCTIAGEISRRQLRGFGPFKKETWEVEPFTCALDVNQGRLSPVDGLEFGLIRMPHGYVVDGSIHGVPCYFDEFYFTENRTMGNFTMVSIANIVVRGKIQLENPLYVLTRSQVYAA